MSPYGPPYDDTWVLNAVNRALGERSTTVSESAQEDLFGDPSVAPSASSDNSSYFQEKDDELEKILRSETLLNSLLLGPHPADIAGLAIVDSYHGPEQYPTSADLDNDVSMGDAHDAVDNVDNHRPSNWLSPGIPFRPSVSGPNGLLAPPPPYTRRFGGRNRSAAMNRNPGTEARHPTPVVVREQDSLVVASITPSTVNQRIANEDVHMTEAPVIPIINEPLPFTLPETQNNHNLGPNPHVSANIADDLLSLDTQSVDDHESISDVSSNASGRSRKLKDREKTKRVRDKGACSACRIQKVDCDSDDECKGCKKFCTKNHLSFVPCIRKRLSEILGSASERWASKNMGGWYESLRKRPIRPGSSDHVVEIRRSPNLNRAYLEVTCREVWFQGSALVDCHPVYFTVPDRSPDDDTICAWSEQDISLENLTTFGGRIEQCLLSYMGFFHDTFVSNGRLSAPAPKEAVQLYKLMENVRNMTCMVKVWAYEVRNMFFTGGRPFSEQLLPVQLHFHLRAGKAISSAERELLKGLDAFLEPPSRPAFTVALWLSMWQVILIYQEVLGQLSSADVMTESDERRNFRRLTEDLFEGVVVMYSNRFRTSAVVKTLLDAMDDVEVFGNEVVALNALTNAWDSRNQFYNELEGKPFPNRQEELLRAYVIAREEKVFKGRRKIGPTQRQKYGRRV
ncbi:hypothetical protein QBC32DRAFT_335002 [Pseudoneurospora amorphoporcata]|uniref:Zn(2)-C6 fungal-type domain-containing protein n=1 Tax=Pseudoneurospora amorphoporcata TaxID=241081 RepID=A0AAN6SIS1_9PEZI|nr:hypothetical protein QBC32DRAFT_335002 [Pseudoneurospora amorphoporcata]